MNPIEILERWVLEYGVINLLFLVVQALKRKHQPYGEIRSSYLMYAEAIEELIPEIEKKYQAKKQEV